MVNAATASARASANRRLTIRLLVVTAAMFGFGYALVPLYDIVCDLTGIGGRTGVVSEATAATGGVDSTRVVKVQFVATVSSGMRWKFDGPEQALEAHPGQVYQANFIASNLSPRPVVAQAVPSVTPAGAAAHFDKIECFCFTRQRLEPGETREMPVRFVVNEEIPRRIGTLTLAYTFFEAEPAAQSAASGNTASDGIRTNG